MGSMFYGCSRLASLDASGWDTSCVTDMSMMFSGCSSLASLDFSGWDASCVTDKILLFDGCNYRPLLFTNPLFRGLFHF